MKSENLIPFAFNGSPVTVIMHNNEPWFIANEICMALDYKNVSQAVADHLDDDERMTVAKCDGQLFSEIMTLSKRYSHSGRRGGAQFLTLISESGMYSLVLRSHKPEAKKFSKWVTREVLPSIRKTGGYSVASEQQPYDPNSLNGPDLAIAQAVHTLIERARYLVGFWHQYGPAIRMLNSNLANGVYDCVWDADWSSSLLAKKLGIPLPPREYFLNYPFDKDSFERKQYYLAHQHN